MRPIGQKHVVVAGATGFIGSELGQSLGEHHHLIGLTRSSRPEIAHYDEARKVDLFSRPNTIAALESADVAVYLVHSMMPSARLVQASFEDLDLLCAENFAYAAAANGVKHIIYVGGLQPAGAHKSRHLQSRREVERALASHGVPVTTIRAGLVIGGKGSSFQILQRLVHRLPAMVCPSWTNTLTSPVAIGDVVWAIQQAIGKTQPTTSVYDVGTASPMTYKELMAKTAKAMGLSRIFIPIPLVTPALSRLWVSLVTGAPKPLVGPLIASLRYEMIARSGTDFRLANDPKTEIESILPQAIREAKNTTEKPRAFRAPAATPSSPKVLSIQRLAIGPGRDAKWAADLYLEWLPTAMKGLNPIAIDLDGDSVLFRVGTKGPVLLSFIREHQTDFETFRVTGGWLAKPNQNGRLEFRTALESNILLTGVYDFEPRLPWWIYRFTQALFHLWIMHRFLYFLNTKPASSGD